MLSRPPRRRAGMTMIELLVVIAIIALLAALLVGALMRARDKGKELQVTTDLKALESGIGQFRVAYHQTPIPCAGGGLRGTFRLCSEYPSPATDNWPEVQYLMRMFQRMSRTDNGLRGKDTSGNWTVQFTTSNPVLLDPNQCMVFFLTGGSFTDYTGFSTDPAKPFDKVSASRKNAFFELPSSKRMSPKEWFTKNATEFPWLMTGGSGAPVNTTNVRWSGASDDAGNQEPWMIDPWGNPYLYFSSNIGNDYPFYLDYPNTGTPTPPADWREALRIGPWGGEYSPYRDGSSSTPPDLVFPDSPGVKGPSPFLETYTAGTTPTRKFMNRQSFQIISAGADGQIGPGSPKVGSNYIDYKPAKTNYTQVDAGGDDFTNFRPLKLSSD